MLLFECIIHNGGNFVSVLTGKYTHTKKEIKTHTIPNNHHTQTALSSPMSSSKPTRGKEAKKERPSSPASGPELRAGVASWRRMPAAAPSTDLRQARGGVRGWEWSGPWDLAAPWSAGEKRLKLEPAGETAPASHPGLFPPNPVSLPPGFFPSPQGLPFLGRRGLLPVFILDLLPKLKIQKSRGRGANSLLG